MLCEEECVQAADVCAPSVSCTSYCTKSRIACFAFAHLAEFFVSQLLLNFFLYVGCCKLNAICARLGILLNK